jgi:hypothetical protein
LATRWTGCGKPVDDCPEMPVDYLWGFGVRLVEGHGMFRCTRAVQALK